MHLEHLISKYNVPGPRYTSYPTVPFWKEEEFSFRSWMRHLNDAKEEIESGISIYIHLPFCERLCTFCGCHKRITKRHSVEAPYIDTLLKEWKLYLGAMDSKPRIKELHLGGGTPTFFNPENLKALISGICKDSEVSTDYVFSFEGHPMNTGRSHLEVLYDLGFRRVSFGVQDYDAKVQAAINRIQPYARVKEVSEEARRIGYTSISHDLIYGLPHQTPETIQNTIRKTKEIRPDRIAFYGYAHVPWIKGVGQRGFLDSDIPKGEKKRLLYEIGKAKLQQAGYSEIGMDHFALPADSLCKAAEAGTLHRNFMGYTEQKTSVLIGLGMSAISGSPGAFAQNEKSLEKYTERVNEGRIPVFRGHILSDKDRIIREHILNLMCRFETHWASESLQFDGMEACIERLQPLIDDGIVQLKSQRLSLAENARPFVRNVCMAFDDYLHQQAPQSRFSKTF